MTDAAHFYGSDLSLDPTGDIALASGTLETEQRIIRRLLTALGDYVQQSGYGAGLGAFVGQPTNALLIAGVVKRQLRKEASVMQSPPPIVTVTQGQAGLVSLSISYKDAQTGSQTVLSVPVS